MVDAVQRKKARQLTSEDGCSHPITNWVAHVLNGWNTLNKYLGVIIQSDLKFDQHIIDKCLKSWKLLGGIKHLIYDAPKRAKLLAYTSLCKPMWCGTLQLEVRFMT